MFRVRGRVQAVSTAVCTDGVHARVQDRVHGRVQVVYTCTRRVDDPLDGRVLGRPHGRVRAVYTAVYTVVYTCTRPYTAVTRPCARTYVQAVYTAV